MNRLDLWWTNHEKTRRYDHSPMYVCMMIALSLSGISLFLWGPAEGSSLALLDIGIQLLFAGMLMFGSLICLFGSATGTKYFFKNWSQRRSYRIGISGVPAVVTSLLFYTISVYSAAQNIQSSLGGTLTPLLCLGATLNGIYFQLEVRRIERNVDRLTEGEYDGS
jgi:hypothetical protein